MGQYVITSREILGKALKAARQKKGLTQSELGDLVGLKQKTVSSVERGLPGVKLDTLFRLVSGLELQFALQSQKNNTMRADEW